MLRSVFGQSAVLRSAFVFSAAAAASGAEVEAAAAATHQQTSDTDASSTAAALWQQHSSSSGAAATHSADASNGSSNALMLFTNSAGSDSAAHEYDSTGSGGYVGFTGGFGPRHLAEVAIVPENGSNNNNTLRTRTALDKARDVDGDAAAFPPGLRAPSAGRRPVITKARRIRLAAAASQAAEVLQAVGTPATALLHSQRVQQLQAEEALLNASLQRLKAERDLAKVRHTYDEELHIFQRGVEQREHNVLLATCPTTKKKKPTQLAAQTDPVVSYSQESGEGEMGGMADGELLGMTATADAEAAAAAAAAAGLAKHKKKQSVVSARAKLQRHSRTAQTRGAEATAAPTRRVASRLTAKAPPPTGASTAAKATTARAGSNVKARAASQPAKASQKPKRKAATRTTPAAKKAMAAKSKPTKASGRGKSISPAPQKQSGSVKKKKAQPPVTTKQLKKKTQHKVAVAAAKPKAAKPAKASQPAQPKKNTKSAPAAKKQTPAAKKRARPTASKGKQSKKSSKK